MEKKASFFGKKNIVLLLLALLFWGVSFVTDTKLFSADGLPVNCLPVDTDMILPMHVLTKLCVLGFWLLFLHFAAGLLRDKRLLFSFLFLLLVYGAGLLVTYPGYYMNDDPILFAYATRYLPVYWHNYLTSLFYMTGMSLFPASCGPVLLSDLFYAMIFTKLFEKSGYRIAALLPAVLPFTLLGALMCFRPAIYASFFLYYFILLYFAYKNRETAGPGRLALLAFLTALLSFWRSESIVLLPLSLLLLCFAYGKERLGKRPVLTLCAFFAGTLLCYGLLSMPQKAGEQKYYGSDYLIISTTRPLSVMVWRDQTYEGAEQDLANISAVTEFGYLHNDSLSCSAYTRYNSDHNEGRYTQTGQDPETQKRYLKSAFRMILHNLDLFFGERLQLFLVTNGIFDYDKSMVLNLKPVVSTDLPLYEHDRDYGFEMLEAYKRVPLATGKGYALFLYRFGGEALIPVLILTLVFLIGALVKRKWFYFFLFGTLLAREGVIFLTAPASFIQYSYPTMYTTAAIGLLMAAEYLGRMRKRPKSEK